MFRSVLGPVGSLRLYYFVAFSVMGVFLPYLPPWLEEQGIVGTRMGMVLGTRPVAMILSPVLFGLLADRLGLRGSLLRWVASGALAVAAVLLGLAASGQLGFWSIFVLLLLFSILRTPLTSLADATVLEGSAVYGPVRLWGSLGFLVTALLIGKYLDWGTRLRWPFALTLALCLTVVATFWIPSHRNRFQQPRLGHRRRLLSRGDFRLLLLIVAGWQLSHSAYDLCISLYLHHLGASHFQVGGAWAIATLSEVLLMALAGKLLEWTSSATLLVVGVAGTMLRWIAVALAPSLGTLLWLQPLHALSFALVWIAALECLRERAEPHAMATAQGLLVGSMAVGSTLGMLVWSRLYLSFGGSSVFIAAATITVPVLLGAAALRLLIHRQSLHRAGLARRNLASAEEAGSFPLRADALAPSSPLGKIDGEMRSAWVSTKS